MATIAHGRVFQRQESADPALLIDLNRSCVPNVADAMHGMGVVEGLSRVGSLHSQVVGSAVTVDVTPGDGLMARAALAQCVVGDILVINAHGNLDRVVLGGSVCIAAKAIGVVAILVDGSVRDIEEIELIGLPVFARNVTPRSGTTDCGWGEVNVPVAIGGVVVMPGDAIMASLEGCLVIPRRDLASVIGSVREVEERKGRPEDLNNRIEVAGATVPGLERALTAMADRGITISQGPY